MDKVLEVDAVSQAARIQGGIYGPAIEDAVARHALHHAPLHAGLSLLDLGRLDRHALGRALRHALHPHRRLRGEHAGRDAGRHARDAPPAGIRRRPQPRPHVPRLRRHPGHHHRSLGAAAQEAHLPRLGLGALQDFLRRRRRGARHHPGRPLSRQLPSAGSARGAARHPVEQRGGGAGAGLRVGRPPARRLDGAGAGNLPRPWRRGRPGGRRRERPSLGRRRRLAQQVHPRAALRRARRGARHPLLDLRDLDDLGARPRLPRQDHRRSPATRSSA